MDHTQPPQTGSVDIPPAATAEQSKDLGKRLDELVKESETTRILDIQLYHADHLQYMHHQYGRFMAQFEMFFSEMDAYSHNINYLDKGAWSPNKGLQFIITTYALKQICTSYELLCTGSYEDSITVLRGAYESFLRVLFISCNPEQPSNAYKFTGQIGIRFNATNLVKDLGLDWIKYGITSAFAHSNMYSVIEEALAMSAREEAKLVILDYEQNDDMISMIMNLLYFLLDVYMMLYDRFFTVDVLKYKGKETTQSHVDKLHTYSLICHELLRTHEVSEYWRKTAVDIEHIFDLIKKMDNDPTLKWRDEWIYIRSKDSKDT